MVKVSLDMGDLNEITAQALKILILLGQGKYDQARLEINDLEKEVDKQRAEKKGGLTF